MKIRKSRVSMAIAAVISAACLTPAASFGYSINLQGTNPGSLNSDSRGDALLFPFYTTTNGATTSFSVTNSGDQAVLAKVRIREQVHSVDAMDFFVALSPHDKFDFTLEHDPGHPGVDNGGGVGKSSGRPEMTWRDTSCVVGPADGQYTDAAKTWRYQVFNRHWAPFVATDEQMAAGHIEVMGLVDLSHTTLAAAVTHSKTTGSPPNCQALTNVLKDPSNVQLLNAGLYANTGGGLSGALVSAGNVLMGRYVVTVPGKGLEGGSNAISLRDSNVADPAGPEDVGAANGGAGFFHVTSQTGQLCSALTGGTGHYNCKLTTADGMNLYSWSSQEWAHPHLAELQTDPTAKTGLIALRKGLAALAVAGDWSNNPANYVGFDWVVTFLDKYLYLDCQEYLNHPDYGIPSACTWAVLKDPKVATGVVIDDLSGVWYGSGQVCATYTDTASVKHPTTCSTVSSDLDVPVSLNVYDYDEGSVTGGVSVSPGSNPQVVLHNELNVMTFVNDDVNPLVAASFIQLNPSSDADTRSWVRQSMHFNLGTNAIRGWAKLDLGWQHGFSSTRKAAAVTGIIFTTRATDDPTINNASVTDLQPFTP